MNERKVLFFLASFNFFELYFFCLLSEKDGVDVGVFGSNNGGLFVVFCVDDFM